MIRRNTEVTQMTDIGTLVAGGKREPLMRANKANNKLQTTTATDNSTACTALTTTTATDVI